MTLNDSWVIIIIKPCKPCKIKIKNLVKPYTQKHIHTQNMCS